MTANPPSKVELQGGSRCLVLTYPDKTFSLSFEFLRVHSPSAEVRGHGIGNEVLQTGKKQVCISAVEPSGNYGLKLVFNDGHDSGIYTWTLLRQYCDEQEPMWQAYLERLAAAGASRE